MNSPTYPGPIAAHAARLAHLRARIERELIEDVLGDLRDATALELIGTERDALTFRYVAHGGVTAPQAWIIRAELSPESYPGPERDLLRAVVVRGDAPREWSREDHADDVADTPDEQ